MNILALMHKIGIRIEGREIEKCFTWKGGYHPIKDIIREPKLYRKSTAHLAKFEIMFLDQLVVNPNNKMIVNWQVLKMLHQKKCNKGPTPLWYTKVKQKVSEEGSGMLSANYASQIYMGNNMEWSHPISLDN